MIPLSGLTAFHHAPTTITQTLRSSNCGRHLAIEPKLEPVSRTAATLFDLSHNKRSLRVEWYIVILMLYEICHA